MFDSSGIENTIETQFSDRSYHEIHISTRSAASFCIHLLQSSNKAKYFGVLHLSQKKANLFVSIDHHEYEYLSSWFGSNPCPWIIYDE